MTYHRKNGGCASNLSFWLNFPSQDYFSLTKLLNEQFSTVSQRLLHSYKPIFQRRTKMARSFGIITIPGILPVDVSLNCFNIFALLIIYTELKWILFLVFFVWNVDSFEMIPTLFSLCSNIRNVVRLLTNRCKDCFGWIIGLQFI